MVPVWTSRDSPQHELLKKHGVTEVVSPSNISNSIRSTGDGSLCVKSTIRYEAHSAPQAPAHGDRRLDETFMVIRRRPQRFDHRAVRFISRGGDGRPSY